LLLFFRLLNHKPAIISPLPHTSYIPSPAHPLPKWNVKLAPLLNPLWLKGQGQTARTHQWPSVTATQNSYEQSQYLYCTFLYSSAVCNILQCSDSCKVNCRCHCNMKECFNMHHLFPISITQCHNTWHRIYSEFWNKKYQTIQML
jgi:hypothetical protein